MEVINITKRKTQTQTPRFSDSISDFLRMVDNAKLDYKWNDAEVSRLDSLTQDYLHQMELGNLDYKQRARMATRLAKCRQERRSSKDTVQILQPLMDYLDSEKGKQAINLMRETLGKTRKTEQAMQTRTYRARVLEDGDIF